MKFFKRQCELNFVPASWERDPELFVMDQLLDARVDIILLATSCFPFAHDETYACVGRDGMTLEQVVRAAIYKQHKRLTYRELSEHTEDSKKGRHFMKMGNRAYFSYQALQENIARITPEVLAQIFVELVQYAVVLGVDDGRKLRPDSTVIRTNVHPPTNASLLWDGIRISCRVLEHAKAKFGVIRMRDYRKGAKRLFFKITNTKGKEKRRPLFKKMLQTERRCMRQVIRAIEALSGMRFSDKVQEQARRDTLHQWEALLPQMEQVTDVAHRREILDEPVPVQDKLFSFFEDHPACIVKKAGEAHFGHKVHLARGKSNLLFDCILKRGTPADSTYLVPPLDHVAQRFGIPPRDVATDGGYASLHTLQQAQARGVRNIVFSKPKGALRNCTTSKKLETMLKKWRAGMEAGISNFKRGLKAGVCPWEGWNDFKRFVLGNAITFNLRVIARVIVLQLASASPHPPLTENERLREEYAQKYQKPPGGYKKTSRGRERDRRYGISLSNPRNRPTCETSNSEK